MLNACSNITSTFEGCNLSKNMEINKAINLFYAFAISYNKGHEHQEPAHNTGWTECSSNITADFRP